MVKVNLLLTISMIVQQRWELFGIYNQFNLGENYGIIITTNLKQS